MRLIDADKLLRDIEHFHLSDGKFQHWVEVQPTAEPVKGEWIPTELSDGKDIVMMGFKKCSCCGDFGFLNEDGYGYWNWQTLTDFCPTCGADMRKTND